MKKIPLNVPKKGMSLTSTKISSKKSIPKKKGITKNQYFLGLLNLIFEDNSILPFYLGNTLYEEIISNENLAHIKRFLKFPDLFFTDSPISCGIKEIDDVGDTYTEWEYWIQDIIKSPNFNKYLNKNIIIKELIFLSMFCNNRILEEIIDNASNCGLFMISIPIQDNESYLIESLKKLSDVHTQNYNPNSGNTIITYLFDSQQFVNKLERRLKTFLTKFKLD